jgi:hypothetical protein
MRNRKHLKQRIILFDKRKIIRKQTLDKNDTAACSVLSNISSRGEKLFLNTFDNTQIPKVKIKREI